MEFVCPIPNFKLNSLVSPLDFTYDSSITLPQTFGVSDYERLTPDAMCGAMLYRVEDTNGIEISYATYSIVNDAVTFDIFDSSLTYLIGTTVTYFTVIEDIVNGQVH